MDFFCQRCGKTVDVDESLLRIDISMVEKGEIDFDRVMSAKRGMPNTPGSHASTMGKRASSVISSSFQTGDASRPKHMQGGSTLSFNVSTPERGGSLRGRNLQTESPIPRHISSTFTRSSKTQTIILEKKTPPATLSTSSPSSASTSSSNSATPPSPTAKASPPMPPQPIYSHSFAPAPGGQAMHKSSSEIFPPHSRLGANQDENSGGRKLTQSQAILPTQTHFDTLPAGSYMTTQKVPLKYLRRASIRPDAFEAPQSNNPTPQPPSHMQSFPSAPNLHHLAAQPPVHSISMADALAASKLFQLVSEQIGVDLPLCNECTKTLTTDLDDELSMMESQNMSYIYFMEQLEQKEKKWPPCADIEEEIARMEEEERELRAQIASLHVQKRAVSREVAHLKSEAGKLVNFEERYWMNFDELHAALSSFVDERDACKVQAATTKDLLGRSQRTQIINDAFHIWHDGHFGTVNSFRLGRLPSQPVDWNEINAAWGLATLLLYNMARRMGFQFSTYKLVPAGSCSKMERLDNNSTYELFGSSDISLGRLFWYRRFDNGMVAFLLCLKEMGDFAESRDKTFKLPHKMEKDKVGDMSIKIQFNNEETWTKSLKYTLTNLKWLLAWVVRMEAEQVAAKNGKQLSANVSNTHLPATNTSATTATITTVVNSSINGSINDITATNTTTTTPATPQANPTPPPQQKSRLTMLFSRAGQ